MYPTPAVLVKISLIDYHIPAFGAHTMPVQVAHRDPVATSNAAVFLFLFFSSTFCCVIQIRCPVHSLHAAHLDLDTSTSFFGVYDCHGEYGLGSDANIKGDVYRFGIIVLEMVTRKRPTDDMFTGGLSLQMGQEPLQRTDRESSGLVTSESNEGSVTRREENVGSCNRRAK
ncbi:hypothetical protein RHMOL_Rhmol12G0219100 [Rhododendron molle]|uniref:Uncharacterized protein n=1 Tax=Rhododendron molle TaxID=49168 RepID=A0ACC0LL98_RHOML|nr:hypothetical protein RHMOL_Rhmol12G0219100 [Rhododendron molle]